MSRYKIDFNGSSVPSFYDLDSTFFQILGTKISFEQGQRPDTPERKIIYFNYDLTNDQLLELKKIYPISIIKVFDCFMLFNELDLMELRLEELHDVVDHFVITESNRSHTGIPKPFHFELNKARFEKYLPKIEYIKIENLPGYDKSPTRGFTDIDWKPENEQRLRLMDGISKYAQPGDRIFVSDLDEIWDKKRLPEALATDERLVFSQAMFYYYTNTRFPSNWNGTVVATYGKFPHTQELRDQRGMYRQLSPGGWHISYAGGVDNVYAKIQNIAESNLMLNRMGTPLKIIQKLATLQDPLERTTLKIDTSYQPNCIEWFNKKFPNFAYKG